jgi:hypothetical protein
MLKAIVNTGRQLVACILLLTPALALAQSAPPSVIKAEFLPGQSVRYEFEGIVQISTENAPDVKLSTPTDCSYHLQSVLRFDFGPSSPGGALPGVVHFQGVRATPPECSGAAKGQELSNILRELEANGTEFEIHPAGDVSLKRPTSSREPEIVNVLLKAAWDLLQPRLSEGPRAAGSPWVASRRYLYWPDTFVEEMEVAASSMQYARDVAVAGKPYSLLQYKQVFSPADMPAYVDARSRARDFTGTTFVTGRSNISLLWDRSAQRVVYAHRQRSVDNRLMLKYESSQPALPVARVAIEEESTVRWLPEENSESWLADLHRFESSAGEITPSTPQSPQTENPLVALAAASRKKETAETAEHRELSDLLDRTPKGFERWQKDYCSGLYCFELSIAVPAGTTVADSTESTVLLLGGPTGHTITVAVGPMLDQQASGLADEDLLRQQTSRFVANNLWFAAGAGQPINFSIENLSDRPAGVSDFTSKARDLTPIRGRLAMVIAPYRRLAPVACSYAEAQRQESDAICQSVTESVVIR